MGTYREVRRVVPSHQNVHNPTFDPSSIRLWTPSFVTDIRRDLRTYQEQLTMPPKRKNPYIEDEAEEKKEEKKEKKKTKVVFFPQENTLTYSLPIFFSGLSPS